MKRVFLALALLTSLAVALPALAQTTGERISQFTSIVQVNPDASATVTEVIKYDFGSNNRHGIYRDIPLTTVAGNNRPVAISVNAVTDEQGTPYQFSVSGGSTLEIKIGDPNALISGVHTYVISYTAHNLVGYFDTYDEVYWNATGNDWHVPIDNARAVIELPQQVSLPSLRVACYAGAEGSTAACESKETGGDAQTTETFEEQQLAPGEGLTVALGFPKGIVAPQTPLSWWEIVLGILLTYGVFILPVAVFVALLWQWYKNGRDPRFTGTVIPEYEPPHNLTPLQIGALKDETISPKTISSQIIYLATKGYIKITAIQEKHLLMTTTDYQLDLLKPTNDLSTYDLVIVNGLFDGASSVTLSEVKRFYKQIPGIKKDAMQSLIELGYFPNDPDKIHRTYYAVGHALFVLGIVLIMFQQVWWGISSLIMCPIVYVFGYLMPRRTPSGVQALNDCNGFKLYLSVAEKDRIAFANAPEKRPETFEQFLPYAMVFGVEKEWAKQFEGIYTTPPSWYSNPYSAGAFNSSLLVANLSSFQTTAASSIAPSGGSGGGGFAGGGGGGGGGGSW